ncbi:TonB-dependent receptor plug domain-containing protein [Xanthomonas sp. NCPPB 2632]|uniref:TonB-dependent receptor plug domain-containing protein n=1 Tax=Xanthomonas sp. NCPPB 2632 TaxID=3240912 RepID=UPI003519C683
MKHALPVRLSLSVLAAAQVYSSAAHAQDDTTKLQTVVVTGTRSVDRSQSSSLSPIDVVSAQDLQSFGDTQLGAILSRLTPSLNFPRAPGNDGSGIVRPAALRGLSPDQTLVLVNGKRWHTSALLNLQGALGRGSAPADLNAIPVSAIDHIEILRDGASAQYGSDAIAGVINVVLKGAAGAGTNTASITTGRYSAGDGRQWQGEASLGVPLGGDKGWARLSLVQGHADATNRGGRDYRDPSSPVYGQHTQRIGEPDIRNHQALLNVQYALTPGVDAYAFASTSSREGTSPALFRTYDSARNVPSIYPDGYLPLNDVRSIDSALVAGVRGTTAHGWRWDISGNYGRDRVGIDPIHTLNVDLGDASPTRFNAGRLTATQKAFDVDLARDLEVGWLNNPLTLAFGLEYLHQQYTIDAGGPASYVGTGAQGFPGFQPGDAGTHSRHDVAEYLSLENQITDKLSGSLAVRHEYYSDFGHTTSGTVSARYDFTDAFALRGTAATGFRAPSLPQQFYTTTSTNVIGGVPTQIRNFAVNDPVARALGAEPLKPEKSHNYTLGAVYAPGAWTLSLDLYQITIGNRVVPSENLVGDDVRAYLDGQGFANIQGGSYFTNALKTRTRGIDLSGGYRLDLGDAGKLQFTAAYNRNHTSILSVAPNPASLAQNGLELVRVGHIAQGYITRGAPRDKIALGTDYGWGHWNLHGALTRYGEFTVNQDPVSNPGFDQVFPARWLLDLSASYATHGWTFTAGVDNLTDVYPQKYKAGSDGAVGGTWPYPDYSPFGYSGRYLYTRVAYRW